MTGREVLVLIKYFESGYDSLVPFDHKLIGLDPWRRDSDVSEQAFSKQAAQVLRGLLEKSAFKFKPLTADVQPSQNTDVLLFLHDKWRGYDEIISASFYDDEYFFKGRKVPKQFIAGWLALPVELAYERYPFAN